MWALAKLLDGFVSMGRGADLARLAADPGATGPLADDIVAAWYSGTYHTRNGLASFGRASRLAAGPQFCRSRWETGLLRQRELHPDLPDRREIRRDRPPLIGRRVALSSTPRRLPRKSKSAPKAASVRSASSVGTAAKAWLRARSSCSRRMRSRSRGCCCTPAARLCRAGWPIAPAKSVAMSWTIRHN
jgi:hypothetical protein